MTHQCDMLIGCPCGHTTVLQVFSSDILAFNALSAGTRFAIAAAELEVFAGLVLDGQRCMSRGCTWDWQVGGRDNTNPENTNQSLCWDWDEADIRAMAASQPGRAAEWNALADRWSGASATSPLYLDSSI